MPELKRHYRRTLLNGCIEEAFVFYGSKSELRKVGPQIGAIDQKTALRVVSRHVEECKQGHTHHSAVHKIPGKRKRPDLRKDVLRLRVWWQPESLSKKIVPWKDRLKKTSAAELQKMLESEGAR